MCRLLFAMFLFLLSCKYNRHDAAAKQTIALIKLGEDSSQLPLFIKSGLEDSLNCTVLLLETKPLPINAYNSSRKRYKADSLLVYLDKQKPIRAQKIIGITSEDIETRNGIIKSWGVMGLGYCPGNSCVVSSYRPRRTAITQEQFLDRMIKLVMHELGHTYSLDHCSNNTCIMQDEKGKMQLDKSTGYCKSCKHVLERKGLVLISDDAQGYSQHTENK